MLTYLKVLREKFASNRTTPLKMDEIRGVLECATDVELQHEVFKNSGLLNEYFKQNPIKFSEIKWYDLSSISHVLGHVLHLGVTILQRGMQISPFKCCKKYSYYLDPCLQIWTMTDRETLQTCSLRTQHLFGTNELNMLSVPKREFTMAYAKTTKKGHSISLIYL